MTKHAPDPLIASWQQLRATLSDDDGVALELLGGRAGAMAISTVVTRMTKGVVEPWETPLAETASAFYRSVRAVALARRARARAVPRLQERARKAGEALDAIMAPRRAAMHLDARSLERAAVDLMGPNSETHVRPPVPDTIVIEATLEVGEIIGSKGGDWLNRYDALLTIFMDAGALLSADEACELFVLMHEFMNGYFNRYVARSSPRTRRRCTNPNVAPVMRCGHFLAGR